MITALAAIASLGAPALSASAASPSADLATTIISPNVTRTGSYLYYTITVTNHGPDPASNVAMTDNTPARTTFYCVGSGTAWCHPGGTPSWCTAPAVGSPTVSCTATSLPPGATMTVTMVVHVGFYWHNQVVVDTASATSNTFDPNTANNTATAWARAS